MTQPEQIGEPLSAAYETWVGRVADAIHEDCRLEWQAIGIVNPGRFVTQHMADAHYGMAHDLVRRLGRAAIPATPDVALAEQPLKGLIGSNQKPRYPDEPEQIGEPLSAEDTSEPRRRHEAEAYLDGDVVRCRVCRVRLRVTHRHPNEGDCYGH